MKLQFKEQDFQIKAVEAVVRVFEGQPNISKQFTLERNQNIIRKAQLETSQTSTLGFENEYLEEIGYRNNQIKVTNNQLEKNIKNIQQRNDIKEITSLEVPKGIDIGLNITVEMETGTGKTYTYIRTMYELHKSYGWSKFIVVVPSIAIREGVYKSFQVTKEHFQALYGSQISPFIYNSKRPQDIENFASDNRISVMIINTQAFAARGKDARRIYQELDQFGSRRPIDIIAQTNPIIIIDEPQSVEGDGKRVSKTMESMQDFKPLCTLRYSATHRREYNKIYRLDALDAYNRKLVKKIQVKGISLKGSTGTSGYLYLEQIELSATKPPVAVVEFEQRSKIGMVKKVRKKLLEGASLYELSGEMPAYKNQTITEIDGYRNKIVVAGEDIYPGDILNHDDETAFRRIQIRECIQSHLQKEKELFKKGIKVLSLFFIDSVDKYRIYDENGAVTIGEYARIFEEEYNKLKGEALELFQEEYNEYLEKTDIRKIHKAYMPNDYVQYIKRDEANTVHNGYFSIDKKGKSVNPTVKRGRENSDDISAYDLIMKDKERLLSFGEPTRFIFSHSALKEGWDNPNVFQICALKNIEGGSTIRRRQEVGRGMRICVNNKGIRQDFETLGTQVHDLNKLTIIASESYESFAKGLQKEIAETLKDRPEKVTVEFFVGKVLTNEKGEKHRITEQEAKKINKLLYKNDIIDEDDKITTEGRESIESGDIKIPEPLEPFKTEITKLIKTVYTRDIIKMENERQHVALKTNKNFKKAEFQALWNKIHFKSVYEVDFDTPKLIEQSRNRINAELNIADRVYEVKLGELQEGDKEAMQGGKLFKEQQTKRNKIANAVHTNTRYDLVGEIEVKTNLTRRTIVEILKAIKQEKFLLFKKNPEQFIAKTARLINEAKSSLVIDSITYQKTDEVYDAKTIFSNDRTVLRRTALLQKHIYDFIETDSGIEQKFVDAMEAATEISIYAKLPKSFSIPTPVGKFSPDWAIVFDKKKVKHIYFVVETKGSESQQDLREIEKLKIECASKHFKAISNNEVAFGKVNNFETLMEIVELS